MVHRARFGLGSQEIKEKLDEIALRPGRTSKRQQEALTSAIHESKPRSGWPRDTERSATRSDAVLCEKILVAIHTGRITKQECQSIAEQMFGAAHRHHFDASMDELERVLASK